jgi:hypothetical protein
VTNESSSFSPYTSPDSRYSVSRVSCEQVDGWSRSRLQRLIEEPMCRQWKAIKASYKVREGDEIDVDLDRAPRAKLNHGDIR